MPKRNWEVGVKNKIILAGPIPIILGLSSGLLFFPGQNFQSSLLVGNIMSVENFSPIILSNLLFISFIVAIIVPLIILTIYSLRNSLR